MNLDPRSESIKMVFGLIWRFAVLFVTGVIIASLLTLLTAISAAGALVWLRFTARPPRRH